MFSLPLVNVSSTPSRSPSAPASRRTLGFVTPSDAYLKDDYLLTNPGLGRLIDALRGRCDRLLVGICRSPQQAKWHDYKTGIPTKDVFALPSMPSIAKGIFYGRRCRAVIREIEGQADALIVQMPFSAPSALLVPRRPRVYHICADLREVVKASRFYRGPRRLAARSLAGSIDLLQQHLVGGREAALITNGEALFANYASRRGRSVISSSIVDADILSVCRERSGDAPFRLLFVGYLRPEKGLDVLLDAYVQLRQALPDAELQIIGTSDLVEDGAARELHERITILQNQGFPVSIHGYVSFGRDLFTHYADADVVVVPSRSEGTPRVLIEARALGCPVVAARVGGIPSSVTDGVDGLLVPPDDASALATAILRIASEPNLRRLLIEGGLERARNTTVECMARSMMEQVELLLSESPASVFDREHGFEC
jgi:glycosyltransferase involved in cell wall biosynthesis